MRRMSVPPEPTAGESRTTGIVMASMSVLAGAFVSGIGLGWVPYDPAKVHAPGWVIVLCGLVFVCGGLAVFSATWNRESKPQPIFGAAILIGLTLICNWVAFGEGERRFTATTSVNDSDIDSRPIDEGAGRFVFGVAAVILDAALATYLISAWRKRFGAGKP